MNIYRFLKFSFILLWLTACAPTSAMTQFPLATNNIPSSPAIKVSSIPPSARTVEDLIKIIYASDPDLSQYDTQSSEYAEFPDALKQLSEMGMGAIDAASQLAVAITYPRQDAYLAAQTLMVLGPDITATTLPVLIDNLHNQRPEVRTYSIILLGSVGSKGSCAVGEVAPLLWDSDPHVRSSVALALEKITGQDLIPSEYEIAISPSFLVNSISVDTPEGKVVGTARDWWNQKGSKINWHPSYGICDP
jgi:hypothetical protein